MTKKSFLAGCVALVGLTLSAASCGRCSREAAPVDRESQPVGQAVQHVASQVREVHNAHTWIFRGSIGDDRRVSVEVLEKSDVSAAMTFCIKGRMFTVDDVGRSRELGTLRYETPDTLVALQVTPGMGVQQLSGTVRFGGREQAVEMVSEGFTISRYPINRYAGLPDSVVAASVRGLQSAFSSADRKAVVALCEWPIRFQGALISDERALAKVSDEKLFAPALCQAVAEAYDHFFCYESENGWYALGRGCVWFVLEPDGGLRIKSISIPAY